MDKIGDLLVDMRQRSGKTQEQMAKYIGVSTRTWQNYEQGVSKISAYDLFKVTVYCRYDLAGVIKDYINFNQRTIVTAGLI